MPTVQVRYIVDDVDAAIAFYVQQLGFHEDMHPAPAFAMLARGDLRLVLSAAGGGPGGGQAMPDGRRPGYVDSDEEEALGEEDISIVHHRPGLSSSHDQPLGERG